jgi:Collagen triple helix repeat (20 copies)
MVSHIHQKLGTAGFIISILALVAALGGGAYAASGGLSGKQKKEVEKIARKYAGKPGANGAQGPAGPAGAKGDAGSKGDTGAPGTSGSNGSNGAPGAQGAPGANGLTGFTATLPPGETETGVWGVPNDHPAPESLSFVQISFPIPLAQEGEAILLNELETEGSATNADGCTGTVKAPIAPPGKLCIYTQEEAHEGTFAGEVRFAGTEEEFVRTGTQISFFSGAEGENPNVLRGNGSWAVTAPTP